MDRFLSFTAKEEKSVTMMSENLRHFLIIAKFGT
jgi:hypothetical protein